MEMINVLKRLAELDAQNPSIVKEDANIAECGTMEMMSPTQPHTPASINMTASSGEELSDMLSAIMKLAGVEPVGPQHLGTETDPSTLVATPVTAVGPAATAGDEMRSVMDKMNAAGAEDGEEADDEEETDEGEYDNTPTGIDDIPTADKSAMINKGMQNQDPAGSPGVGDRNDGKQPKAFATFEESLMSDYQEFIAEGKECKVCEKPVKKCTCD
jgi:hypothetical protein